MNFKDIYNNNPFRFSVEVFPPKTEKGTEKLFEELTKLKSIQPAYVSVTYGAMGTTRSLTKDLALRVHDELQLPTAFHFTCVGAGPVDIRNYVEQLHQRGVNMVVALRGDQPSDPNYIPPEDGFSHANELVAYLKSLKDFSMAVAGYPEKHPDAPSIEEDIENLKRKVDAGADIIITQLFFDNTLFFEWVKKVRSAGITIPIIAGVMPILKLAQIEKITGMCGASLPKALKEKLEACQSESEMEQVGVDYATSQCRDLIQNGVQGIHLYCLNKSDSTLKIVENCKDLMPNSA